jgi:hypothetical protein
MPQEQICDVISIKKVQKQGIFTPMFFIFA